jgi:PAS domain S-box-containing protein
MIARSADPGRASSATVAELTDELERTRDALRESEERLRQLTANIPGAVYRRMLDPSMTVEFVGDTIEELTGYAADQLIGNREREYASLVHPEDLARVREEIGAAIRDDCHYGLAYRIVRADGEELWVGDRGRADVREGEPIWLYGTISDIHERKQLEADRARMEVELRMAQKLEAVGQLAAGIAHEINTPVQFLGDSLQFLKDSFDSLDYLLVTYRDTCAGLTADPAHAALRERLEQAEEEADLTYLRERVPAACERTLEGVERVASIVRAMKEFAHPQTEQAPADLNRALESTLTVARHEYKYVAEVHTQLAELPMVVCNLSDLNQVFLNLIVNAAHAIEDVVEPGEKGTIRVSTERSGDAVLVRIADSGGGIPADVRTRIFDPFFTTKEVGRGSGQGLAIARAVVEKHRGSLGLETAVGRGTTFTIRLPVGGVQTTERTAA